MSHAWERGLSCAAVRLLAPLLAACAGDAQGPAQPDPPEAAAHERRSTDAAVLRDAPPDAALGPGATAQDGPGVASDRPLAHDARDTSPISDAATARLDTFPIDSAGGSMGGGEGLMVVGVGPVTTPAARVEGGVTYLSTGQGRMNGPLPTSRAGPDNFAFLQRIVTGDFEVTARLLSFEGTCEVAKMGLMMRASAEPYAVYTSYTFFNTAIGTRLQQNYREVDGAGNPVPPRDTKLVPVPLPVWMRLRRQGQSFSTSRSADGINWVQAFRLSVPVPATYHVGLFTGTAGASCEAGFDSISIEPVRKP